MPEEAVNMDEASSDAAQSWDDALNALDFDEPPEAGDADEAASDAEASADEEVPTDAEVDAPTATEAEPPPSAEASDEGTAPEAQAAPEAGDETPDSLTEAEPEPFSFRVDGVDVAVEGAELVDLGEDGGKQIVMSPESWQRFVQPRLADRNAWTQERAQYVRRIQELDPSKNEHVLRAHALTQQMQQLLDAGPEALVQWAQNYEQNKQVLLAQAEQQLLRAENQRLAQTHEQQQLAEQQKQLEPQLRTALDNSIDQVRDQMFAGMQLPEKAKKRIADRLWRVRDKLFFVADETNAATHGVTPGTPMIQTDWIKDELDSYRTLASEFTTKQQEQKKVAERNRKALGQKRRKTAPAVSAKGAETPTAQPKKPESLEEWQDQVANLKI